MTYYLSNLIADAMRYQGADAFDIRVATDGSTTTMTDTVLEDKYGDDEFKDGTLIVLRTPLGLAPMNEASRITAYSEADNQFTFGAVTAAVAASDTCMIVSPEYPWRLLVELANDALRDCGEITWVDRNTTTSADLTEYDISSSFKDLVSIRYPAETTTDAENWQEVKWKRIIPSASGVDAKVELWEALDADLQLEFVYKGFHEKVSAYNSPINEGIKPPFAALLLADKVMQWYGVTDENRNYANKILAELEVARRAYPVLREEKKQRFLSWGGS